MTASQLKALVWTRYYSFFVVSLLLTIINNEVSAQGPRKRRWEQGRRRGFSSSSFPSLNSMAAYWNKEKNRDEPGTTWPRQEWHYMALDKNGQVAGEKSKT